jgi:hypothetical protein
MDFISRQQIENNEPMRIIQTPPTPSQSEPDISPRNRNDGYACVILRHTFRGHVHFSAFHQQRINNVLQA